MGESARTSSRTAVPVSLRVGNFFFRHRNALFPAVFVPLLVGLEPRPWGGDWRADRWFDAAGLGLAAVGQALRVLVIGLAYIRRGGKQGRIYADALVQEGLFAHSRNPLYLGNLLIVAGLLIVHGNPLACALGGPFFLGAYLAITAAEEDYLAGRFGAVYREYCRRVPRFVPRLSGLGATLRGMRFDWRKVVIKEYGTLYLTVSITLALLAREIVSRAGDLRVTAGLIVLGVLWCGSTVLYAVARILKKRRLLESGG